MRGRTVLIDARVLSAQRGGVARIAVSLLEAMVDNPEINVVCVVMRGTAYADLPAAPNIEYVELRFPFGVARFMKVIVEHTNLYWLIARRRPDIAVFLNYTMPIFPIRALVERVFLGLWDVTFHTNPDHYSAGERAVLRWPSKFGAMRADGVLTCSEFDAAQIKSVFPFVNNIFVAQLSAGREFFDDSPQLSQHSKSNSGTGEITVGGKYILSLGVIYNRRRLDAIVAAFVELKKRGELKDYTLVVIGKDKTRPHQNIKEQCALHAAFIQYTEFVDESKLRSAYANAAAFICLSEIDGEAILLKEAAAVGTLLITTRELVGAVGGNAIVVEAPVSPVSVADALMRVPDAISSGRKMIDEARRYVRDIDQRAEFSKMVQFLLREVKDD